MDSKLFDIYGKAETLKGIRSVPPYYLVGIMEGTFLFLEPLPPSDDLTLRSRVGSVSVKYYLTRYYTLALLVSRYVHYILALPLSRRERK